MVILLFGAALFVVQAIHAVALFLDNILFPGYKKVRIQEPTFMLGIPRSGSTFLHRLLAKDTDNFTTLNLWEMVFAPAIIERKLFSSLGWLDRLIGSPLLRLLKWLDRKVFKAVRKIHRVSLFEPEEDDLVLLPIFASIFLLFPFPFPEELWGLAFFDRQTPEPVKRRIMEFYKACVQRHLYVQGTGKRFLSKNPAFSPKVDALNAWFPDSRAVCTVRNPYSALPSLLSFLSFTWERFRNDPKGSTFRDMVVELAGHWYRHPMERLPLWPGDRHAFVLYDDLIRDPKEIVERLYTRLGLAISPDFAQCLDAEREKARAYRSKHEYSLADYDLDPAQVFADFRDVYEYYGFEADCAKAIGPNGD